MAVVGIAQLHQTRESLERRASAIEATLSEAEAAVATLPSDAAFRRLSLSRALRDRTEAIKQTEKTIDQTTGALGLLERSQSILVSLQQRLRASARELMEHTHDGTHCPLCGAEYAEAELESRLNDAVRGAANDESDGLRAQLHDRRRAIDDSGRTSRRPITVGCHPNASLAISFRTSRTFSSSFRMVASRLANSDFTSSTRTAPTRASPPMTSIEPRSPKIE